MEVLSRMSFLYQAFNEAFGQLAPCSKRSLRENKFRVSWRRLPYFWKCPIYFREDCHRVRGGQAKWTQMKPNGLRCDFSHIRLSRFFLVIVAVNYLVIPCVCVCTLSPFSRVWLCNPMDYSPLSMGSPGKNTGVGIHFLLQGIFLTQRSNPGPWIAGRFFTIWATREAHSTSHLYLILTIC